MMKMRNQAFVESIDNHYNWLGIDEQEAKKLAPVHAAHEDHIHAEMVHSHEDWGNPQDRSNMFIDCYGQNLIDYHDVGMSNNYPYDKGRPNHSEEIVAVNDTENEMIVPHDMEVQHLAEGDYEEHLY